MEIGLGALALPPQQFWAMTPKELDAALRGRLGAVQALEPPSSDDVKALMDQFPDYPDEGEERPLQWTQHP
jgi:uncharacterized phage protein (TIGR02216 family)